MSTLRRSAALIAALCAVAAHAGLKITTEMKRKGKTSAATMQFEGKNIRMDMAKEGSAEPGHGFISDGDNKKLVMIDFSKKEYHEITQEQMKQMRAKMDAAMAQMKEKLAQLPPEQRQKIEAAMGGGKKPMAPEEKYTRASGSKTIAGYKCDLYTVEVEGKKVADTCLIPWAALKGVDREQLKQTVDAMSEIWGGGFGMNPRMGERPSLPLMRSWGLPLGLPAWRKSVKDDEEDASETTLTGLTQAAVPRATFDPPAGFAKKTIERGE